MPCWKVRISRSVRYFFICPNSCSILSMRSCRAMILSALGVFWSFSDIASLIKLLRSPSGMRRAISR